MGNEVQVKPIKLNLGSGIDIRTDFLNIDIQAFPNVDIIADVTENLPFKDNSVDFIVAQKLLSYLPRAKLLSSMNEWKRILKPRHTLEIRSLDISLLTKALYLNTISDEMGLHHEMVIALLYGKQVDKYDIRYNGFTSEILQGMLIGLGFIIVNVVFEDYDVIITAEKI